MSKILFETLGFENSEYCISLTISTHLTFFFSEKSAKLKERNRKVDFDEN